MTLHFLVWLLLINCRFLIDAETGKRQEDGLATLIRNSFFNFGSYLASGIYDLRVPSMDPVSVNRKFTFEDTESYNDMKGIFNKMNISGLSNMTVDAVEISIPDMHLMMSFIISYLRVDGEYSIDGIYQQFFPIHGEGEFWVQANETVATVNVKMKMNKEKSSLDVDELNSTFESRGIVQKFYGLLGGGNVGALMNHFARTVGEKVFETLENFLKRSFGEAIRRKMVQTLRKIRVNVEPNVLSRRALPMEMVRSSENFNDYLDRVLENVRRHIKEQNLDPVAIPDWTTDFFTNGSLYGLGTIQRSSDAEIGWEDSDINIVISVSFERLTAIYDWRKRLWIELSGIARMIVNGIIIQLHIRTNLLETGKPQLSVTHLNVIDVGEISVNVTGLGPFGHILSVITNKLAEDFGVSFFQLLEGPLKSIVQKSLNRLIVANSDVTDSYM